MIKFLKKKKSDTVLEAMDGREIKYVTKRIKEGDTVKEEIMGKRGRIAAIDGEIRIMCGEKDVFRCVCENAEYYNLLSGDGITVSEINSITNKKEDLTVYYTYYRK